MKNLIYLLIIVGNFSFAQHADKSIKHVQLDSLVTDEMKQALSLADDYYAKMTDNVRAFAISGDKGLSSQSGKNGFKIVSFPILTGVQDKTWKGFLFLENLKGSKSYFLMSVMSDSYPDKSNEIKNVSFLRLNLSSKTVEVIKPEEYKWGLFKDSKTEYSEKTISLKLNLEGSNELDLYFSIPSVEVSAKTQNFYNSLEPKLRKFINDN